MKRYLSFLLVLVMFLGMIPATTLTASAASNIVAKVEAVGTGYAYDSEAGAYAPIFSSMTAYDPGGNAIDIEGFVWSTPFYTTESFGSANRLFYEPEDGETYYFAIYVDQYVNKDVSYDYTSSNDLMEKSVVTLPGFDVECISFMEREMQSYLELTYAATRKYHVVEVGGTKLYDGDTYQGSKGGTLTVDGYNVTMNNFKDPSSVYFANPHCKAYYEENRPVYSDMLETVKLTIIGENSVGGMNAMRDLEIYGTMYDSLTIQGKLGLQYYDPPAASSTDADEYWDCWIYGGNYKMNEIDFSGSYKTYQDLHIYDGASVEVSGEVNVCVMRVENSKLAANSIYSSVKGHNATGLSFRNSRIELIDRMYHRWPTESDYWVDIYGGAFKGKTDYIESSVPERESFGCLAFYAEMVGTGSVGDFSGDITVKATVYKHSTKPFPYHYIDVECKDARSIACENATASAETAVPGTVVTITADPAPEGKVFYRWEIKGLIKDIADPYAPTTTFTMDVADVQVIATYATYKDPYFTPNYEHGNTEGDIITGITYVPNGDGTFNANVHVDVSCVDGQMLQHEWYGTGYYWYDHNNKLTSGIGTTDTDKLVFTLYNVGENLVPGEEWRVKVYLAYDPYCDDEWREVDFPYVTDTVPEFKAHTCADSNNDHKCDTCGADVSECIDSNSDYKCDICGKDLGTPAPTGVTRLAGANRWATSLMVADEMKANLGVEKFDAIIVASGNDFADALAGSYLSTVKNAPILLGWGKGGKYVTLDEANIEYIKNNLASGGTVYILGGKNAVPELYETSLSGYNVKRLGGANRFETNLLILAEAGVKDGSEILVCTSTNFADSLSASATAKPILLVFNEYGKLYGKQPEFLSNLKNCTFTVIGGESAVSAKLADAIKAYGAVTRLAGANRFETSVMVAQKYFNQPTTAVLAYAWNYPDGLCGGSLAYSLKAPLILTMTKYEAKAVEYAKAAGITSGIVLGGDSLISDAAVRAIFAMEAGSEILLKK